MIGCCPEFQSTPPVWEATIAFSASSPVNPGFNPRLPCGRRLLTSVNLEHCKQVFQSTPPVWEATRKTSQAIPLRQVSIHASRVGGDRIASALSCISRQFQSTPPVWEATNWSDADELGNVVSIHASRVGGDSMALYRWARMTCFNPRLPCGRRHDAQYQQPAQGVSIHASRVGGDICRRSNRNACHVSIHASRVGGDKRRKYCSPPGVFQSTPPVWEATRVQRQTS